MNNFYGLRTLSERLVSLFRPRRAAEKTAPSISIMRAVRREMG